NTATDPDYHNSPGGTGVGVKGHVINCVVEYNYLHDTNATGIVTSGNETYHYGTGPTNIVLRYNIIKKTRTGALAISDTHSGADPQSVQVYGNIVYDCPQPSAGFAMPDRLGNTVDVVVYNNTFINAQVYIDCPNATFSRFEFENNLMVTTSSVGPLYDSV